MEIYFLMFVSSRQFVDEFGIETCILISLKDMITEIVPLEM